MASAPFFGIRAMATEKGETNHSLDQTLLFRSRTSSRESKESEDKADLHV